MGLPMSLWLIHIDIWWKPTQYSWESLGLQGDPTSPSWSKSVLNIHWKDWCWSWNSNTLATWCEELTHLKRPWCWERLKAQGEGDDRGWDGWMASPTQWTWVWVNSRSWWWTGRPGVLQSMLSQSQTWLSNWTEMNTYIQNIERWYYKTYLQSSNGDTDIMNRLMDMARVAGGMRRSGWRVWRE